MGHSNNLYIYIFLSPSFESEAQRQRFFFFALLLTPSQLGDFDTDRNPNSETLHAILLFRENQELLQFADAYVLIPFSMKKRPSAVCNKGYVSTWWLFSHLAKASGAGGEASVPGLGFDPVLEAFLKTRS